MIALFTLFTIASADFFVKNIDGEPGKKSMKQEYAAIMLKMVNKNQLTQLQLNVNGVNKFLVDLITIQIWNKC